MQPPRQHEVRLVITRILRPPHAPRRGGRRFPPPPVPLRSTAARLAAHPSPQRCSAPRPAASCSCLTSCLRPPKTPVAMRQGLRFGNVLRVVHIARSRGHLRALRRQVLSSSLAALPRSCLTCAAWSFLRDHLTPRPAAAKSTYRFCVRKIRCSPALQKTRNPRAGESPPIPRVPGEVGWASMVRAVICWRRSFVASKRHLHSTPAIPRPWPQRRGVSQNSSPHTARPHPRSKELRRLRGRSGGVLVHEGF